MVRSKFGLKALGFCAMLISMMAFSSVAQAETGAFWEVNKAKFAGKESVEAETDVAGTLLTELGGKFIHLTCPGKILVIGHITGTVVLGKIIFHGCIFLSLKTAGGELVLQKACEPFVGADKGLIETNQITGLIVLHEPKAGEKIGSIEAKPTEAGGLFATINLGPECAFGENIKVGGVFFLKDTAFTTNAVQHLVSELATLTKLTINGGAKTATIDGSAFAFLSGANKGLTFSGHPA